MIRKIAVEALRPGMYIHDLGCSWVEHPFLLSRFLLRSEGEVQKILDAGITEVSIDTERGADAPIQPRVGEIAPEARSVDPARPTRDANVTRLVRGAKAPAHVPGTQDVPQRRSTTAPARRSADEATGVREAAGASPARGVEAARDAKAFEGRPATHDAEPGGAQSAAGPEQQIAANAVAPAQPPVPDPVRIATEFQEAKRVHVESCRVVRDMLTDVRLGKQVSIERTHTVVTNLAESILRDPGPLLALCRLKQKDEYTFQHCVSVSALLMVFARAAGLDEATIREAGVGGLLHDVGKMTIPPEILNKPGPLTEREVAAMRKHVESGIAILQATAGVSPIALQIVAEHHERHDGTGYPRGLKGDSISRIGHMAAIVDVYDAMTSDRVYRRAFTPADALKMLLERSGSHVEPGLAQLLIKTLGIYPTGSLVMLESGRLAIVVEQRSGSLLHPRVRVVYDTRKASFVPPFDVDLARAAGHGGEDRIVRHESPLKWSVDPLAYLLEKVA